MNKRINVLVTGCGGDIGQSIGKILKEFDLIENIIGCDIHDKHAGLFIFDKCFTIPRVSEPMYVDSINKLIKEHNIDLVIPISEPELRNYAINNLHTLFNNVKVILPNIEALRIGFDKYETIQFLNENRLPVPETYFLSDYKRPQLPCILKDRTGSGSKGTILIETMLDYDYYKTKYPGYLYQEYSDDSEGEYTCGLFHWETETRTIIYKRNLLGGFSGYGEVVYNEAINSLLYRIAEGLNLKGSINVQLRLVKGVPMVFEINPRFSSTVRFRDMMGFKDVIWSIQAIMNINIDKYTPAGEGSKFYKGFSEYIINN